MPRARPEIPKEEDKNLCEWITIIAPQTIHEPPATESDPWPWLDILHALRAREACEGFQGCQWTRVLEEQSQIWIWTSWRNKACYEKQFDCPQTRDVYAKLSALSTETPSTKLVLFDQNSSYNVPHTCWNRFDAAWPSVTILRFRDRLSEDQRRQVHKIRGLEPPSTNYPYTMRFIAIPARGFFLSHARESIWPWTENQHDTYIMLDYWADPHVERAAISLEIDTDDGDTIPAWTLFEKQARRIGEVDIEVKHMKFNTPDELLDRVPEIRAEGQSIVFKGPPRRVTQCLKGKRPC